MGSSGRSYRPLCLHYSRFFGPRPMGRWVWRCLGRYWMSCGRLGYPDVRLIDRLRTAVPGLNVTAPINPRHSIVLVEQRLRSCDVVGVNGCRKAGIRSSNSLVRSEKSARSTRVSNLLLKPQAFLIFSSPKGIARFNPGHPRKQILMICDSIIDSITVSEVNGFIGCVTIAPKPSYIAAKR